MISKYLGGKKRGDFMQLPKWFWFLVVLFNVLEFATIPLLVMYDKKTICQYTGSQETQN